MGDPGAPSECAQVLVRAGGCRIPPEQVLPQSFPLRMVPYLMASPIPAHLCTPLHALGGWGEGAAPSPPPEVTVGAVGGCLRGISPISDNPWPHTLRTIWHDCPTPASKPRPGAFRMVRRRGRYSRRQSSGTFQSSDSNPGSWAQKSCPLNRLLSLRVVEE